MGKIGQNPKNRQLWRPIAPQPYVVEKSWPTSVSAWPLGYIQRGVNSISLQCITWPVACSEKGVCLTDFRFQILGANDPWSKNFRKCLFGFRDGTPKYVSWPNLVKIGHCEVAKRSCGLLNKKLTLRGTRPSPHVAQNGLIAPKIPGTLSPLDISTYTKFNPDRLRFARLFWKDCFFGPKSQYNKAFSLQ